MQEAARDYVRTQVFFAFSDYRPRQSDEDPARYRVPASHRRKALTQEQRIRLNIFGSWFRTAATETRPAGKSSCPLAPWAFEDAKVVRLVNALPDDQRHWIKYAYCPDERRTWDDESGAVIALWQAYKPQIGNVRGATLKKLQGLAHLCIQDMKAQCNRGQSDHKPARLQALLDVNESNWRQHWLPRWRAMQEIVRDMDSKALAVLWVELEAIADEHAVA